MALTQTLARGHPWNQEKPVTLMANGTHLGGRRSALSGSWGGAKRKRKDLELAKHDLFLDEMRFYTVNRISQKPLPTPLL